MKSRTTQKQYFEVKFIHHKDGTHPEELVYLTFEEFPTDNQVRGRLEGLSWTGQSILILSVKKSNRETALNHMVKFD